MHYTDYIMGLTARWQSGSNVYYVTDEDTGITTRHAAIQRKGQPWLVLKHMRETCAKMALRKVDENAI